MITTEVTSEQIENWKKIYSENKNNLVPKFPGQLYLD